MNDMVPIKLEYELSCYYFKIVSNNSNLIKLKYEMSWYYFEIVSYNSKMFMKISEFT